MWPPPDQRPRALVGAMQLELASCTTPRRRWLMNHRLQLHNVHQEVRA